MGCVSSKIQDEDAVGQCEARKAFVKQAVAVRTALVVAHVRYVHALAATSLAFKQFSDSKLGFRSSSDAAIPSPTKMPPPISNPDEEEDQEEEDEQQSPSPASMASASASARKFPWDGSRWYPCLARVSAYLIAEEWSSDLNCRMR